MTASLAARLEAAERGSRELSDAVLEALGWTISYQDGAWWLDDGVSDAVHRWDQQPSPTESAEDAIALAPDGTEIIMHINVGMGVVFVRSGDLMVKAATPALALSASLVRALEDKP